MSVFLLLLPVLATAAQPPSGTLVVASDRLPLVAEGGILTIREDKESKALSRVFHLATPGVWYLWLKASSASDEPGLVEYSMDGEQPLKKHKRQFVIRAEKPEWMSLTRDPYFRAQVHVGKAGNHALELILKRGKVRIEKIALTLFTSAVPTGGGLDHSNDPGGGRAAFPSGGLSVDGFRGDFPSSPVRAARSFHVDPEKGDDSLDGRAPATAWRTFRNVNGRKFLPGDAILLRRGGHWEEGLAPLGDGTKERPVTLGAYGEGPRPLVNGINRDAVLLANLSHWVVRDLECTSDPDYGRAGVMAAAAKNLPQPRDVRIVNCVAFDNGAHGFLVGGEWGNGEGYDGVVVENCLAFWNGETGIHVSGTARGSSRNIVVRGCTAFGNLGMGGIFVASAQNGIVERCRAYNNILVNIWVWHAVNVTMRACEAFRGYVPGEGEGFDIDYGCNACTVEYCYAHHNEGPGFMIMGNGATVWPDFWKESLHNLMRYCVAEDNSRQSVWVIETFQHGLVYNNTATARGKGNTAFSVDGWPDGKWDGGWPSDTGFFNNIAVGRDGADTMWVDKHATRQRNVFDNNLYFKVRTGKPLYQWDGTNYDPRWWDPKGPGPSKATCAETAGAMRRVTGQEAHSLVADPLLAAPGEGGIGRLPMAAYRLGEGSPARRAGRPEPLTKEWLAERAKHLTETGAAEYGISMEPAPAAVDYGGRPVDPAAPSMGAM